MTPTEQQRELKNKMITLQNTIDGLKLERKGSSEEINDHVQKINASFEPARLRANRDKLRQGHSG